jgi:drug/metabolite transporter (DMT)-like permease
VQVRLCWNDQGRVLFGAVPASVALIVLPLIAAFLYTFSALGLKRASALGVGLWRSTFVANGLIALLFSSLWFILPAQPVVMANLWQPLIIAVLLYGGQLSQFYALERGDVSVAVPVFGVKVILVALVTPLLTGDVVSTRLWIAAVLSVAGVLFLNRKEVGRPSRNVGVTLVAGGIGSVCFALFDVLVQKWGPAWGAGRLLPLIYGMNAVLSLTLITKFRAPLHAIPRAAWPWLLGGAALMGLQAMTFVSTLAIYGKATTANVIYSSRGLLSVVFVWLIGHWFTNDEQSLGSRVLVWRLVGAVLMLSAIVLVMMG